MRTKTRRAKRAVAPLETRVVAAALGLFAVVSFLVCIVWGLFTPSRVRVLVIRAREDLTILTAVLRLEHQSIRRNEACS